MATKKRNRRYTEKNKKIPITAILVSFSGGALIMFLYFLSQSIDNKKVTQPTQQVKEKTIEPTFDFYDILPEMEVKVTPPPQVSAKKENEKRPVEKKEQTKKTDKSVRYLIQVGSFRVKTDAERYKAEIALLGIASTIQAVTIDNQATWHRVLIGPIDGLQQAKAMQKTLASRNIKGFLLRTRRNIP